MGKIAFFGTSHTWGDCAEEPNGCVSNPWPQFVAKDSLNYSMSGATNFELSVIINEAFLLNYLDEVDTVILEPRTGFSALMWNKLEEGFELGNDPLIKSSWEFRNIKTDCPHFNWTIEIGTGDFMSDERIRRKIFGKGGNLISKLEIDEIKKSVSTYSIQNGNTNSMLYQNLNFIRTVKLLCDAYNKKFYWVNWETADHVDIKLHPSMFEDVLDCCLNPEMSMKRYIFNIDKKLSCSCGHLNAKAQPIIAKFITEKLNDKRTNH